MAAFMKFGSIVGDATQKVGGTDLIADPALLEKDGWIGISDFSWNIGRKITVKAGPQGKTSDPLEPTLSDITVKKDADITTWQLLNSICYNKKPDTCTVIFVKTGNPAQVYMQYKLSNVFLTSVSISLDPTDKGPIETLVINYTKVEMVNYSSDESNVLIKSKTNRFEFDKLSAAAGHSAQGNQR